MGVNYNRNSIHVLRTTGVGWLAHQNIPNLSIGTDQDFTIQVYVLTANDADGILYAQEGGFRLLLSNGVPFFQLDGFATLSAGADWTLGNHSCYYIAVRYQAGKLSMFLGGLPVAEAGATPTQACSGAFIMGKGFAGGLPLIRVSARALTDQEILQHNVQMPAADSGCVFQSDCQTLQYKDVSANHLPIWACGEGAGCGMYTACTTFVGRGQCACTPQAELGGDHTVLLKLWPYSSEARQCVYTAMHGADTVYSVELVPQPDATFSICLSDGTAQVISQKALLPALWQDIALVFSQGKVQLYLDGAADVQADFSLRAARTALIIGAEYGAGPVYERGYQGHLAYSAEFSRALTAQEAAVYADDPPYLFAKDLATLLPFDWAGEPEQIGNVPISTTGYAQFSLAPDTTPIDTPIGVSMLLPDEESPEWAQMSREDRWSLNQIASLSQAIYPVMLGYPADGTDGKAPVQRRAPRTLQRSFYKAMRESREASPCPTGREAWPYAEGMTIYARPAGVPAAFGAAGSAATFFTLGAPFACLQSHWGAVAAVAAVAVAVTAAVCAVVSSSQSDRPKPEHSPLEVTGICWNHLGEPTYGGLHYHCGGANLPASMVDAPGENELQTRCVLVPLELRAPTVDVTLHYADTAPAPLHAVLEAIDLESGKLLGDTSQAFTIAPGESVTVTLPYDASKLPARAIGRVVNRWQFRAENTFLINCNCTIYTLQALPIAPWAVGNGTAYDPANGAYIWLEMLDFFLPGTDAPDDFAAHAVQRLNASGFVYDAQYGRCCYCDPQNGKFKLKKFVEHAKSPAGHALNCSDCAHIVSTACAMAGIDLPMAIMSTGYLAQGFLCNGIVAIGDNQWKPPFDHGTGSGGFSYHQFNISGAALNQNTPIYDACLKVDGGISPGGGIAGAEKIALLPQALAASETNQLYVNVPPDQPYQTQVYRERLVKHGQPCWFVHCLYRVQLLDVASAQAQKRAAPYEDPRIQAMLSHFALTPKGDGAKRQYTADFRWPAADGGQLERIEEEADHQLRRLVWHSERCQVEHWRCENEAGAAVRLAATLAYIAHPDICAGEDGQIAVGERCFLVADGGVLFMRSGHVFAVYADTLACARSLAQALDQSVGG